MSKKTNNKKTVEIVGILDRSGSMSSLIDETITGYNAFIKEQREAGPAKVTLVIFDDQYDVLYSRVDINEVPKLTRADFYARGWTALRDAMGKTINTVHGQQKNGSKADNTLVFVVTDGYENASKEFSHGDIRRMVNRRAKKGWEFFFIGADIDAFDQGGAVGITTKNIAKSTSTPAGVAQAYATVSNTANLYRGGGMLNESYTMEDMYADSESDADRFGTSITWDPNNPLDTLDKIDTTTPSWRNLASYTPDEEED